MNALTAEQLDSLAYQFFKEFSRCEYCLKAVGFRHQSRGAKANWNTFAATLTEVFEKPPTNEFKAAIEKFLSKPPKKQVVVDEHLDWDETLPEAKSKAELVLLLVCRVRNNLFHGGKFNGRWFEPERSNELLSASLTILDTCVRASPLVEEAYQGAAPLQHY